MLKNVPRHQRCVTTPVRRRGGHARRRLSARGAFPRARAMSAVRRRRSGAPQDAPPPAALAGSGAADSAGGGAAAAARPHAHAGAGAAADADALLRERFHDHLGTQVLLGNMVRARARGGSRGGGARARAPQRGPSFFRGGAMEPRRCRPSLSPARARARARARTHTPCSPR
jgi:hypothetical protein